MNAALAIGVSPEWLALREPADAAARAADLVGELQRDLPTDRPATIYDLGCGTGSMGRWLGPRLVGAQHWILVDREVDLLTVAATGSAELSGSEGMGGSAELSTGFRQDAPIIIETRQRDVTRLERSDLAGADLITASALLDMLTADELGSFAIACVDAKCPVFMTLSVTGRVELTPADPFDRQIADAFNAHQRRMTEGRGKLLGPDAVGAAVDTFTGLGLEVSVRPSPWRLGPAHAGLAAAWLAGWIGAAHEQRPGLGRLNPDYLPRRTAEAAAGRLGVVVHHLDLLARPWWLDRSAR